MANGTLGKAALIGGTNTPIYTAGGSLMALVNINFVNLDPIKEAKVRIAVGKLVSVSPEDYVEYNVKLDPDGGVLERTGLVIGPLDIVYVYSDISNVTARIYGYESPA